MSLKKLHAKHADLSERRRLSSRGVADQWARFSSSRRGPTPNYMRADRGGLGLVPNLKLVPPPRADEAESSEDAELLGLDGMNVFVRLRSAGPNPSRLSGKFALAMSPNATSTVKHHQPYQYPLFYGGGGGETGVGGGSIGAASVGREHGF